MLTPLKISKNKENLLKKQDNLNDVLLETKKIIDPVIKQVLCSYTGKETKNIIGYPIETGGKRFRPALTILSCLACGGKIKDVIYPAAGIEILHENSLIVDDIIDHSQKRRGQKTCWLKFGQSITECLSLDYSAAIFQTAVFSKNPVLISDIFSKAMKILIDGEILDILFEQSGRENEKYVVGHRYRKISERDYFKMIKGKTAFLAETCCQIGAISASAPDKQIKSLKKYGENLGIAFQLSDDILDIFGDEKKFGKKIGQDIEEKKLGNIVILFAFQELSSKEKKEVLGVLRKPAPTDRTGARAGKQEKDIKKAIFLIKKTKAKERAAKLAEKYIKRAKKNLEDLPQNKWTEILGELAEFVISREK